MDFEFDPVKNRKNIEKHNLSFDNVTLFDWTVSLVEPDVRFEYGEDRYIAYIPYRDRLYVVCFTPRATSYRIISLRKANERERKHYEEETTHK